MANQGTQPLKSILPMDNVGIDLASEVLASSVLPVANGGTGSGLGVAAVNGQVYIGNTGTGLFAPATITGTANQITVTNGAGTITLSAPQALAAASSPTFAALTLTTPLTVANGGSGLATLTANCVLIGEGTGTVTCVGPGTTNTCLVSNGAGADPSFKVLPVGGGGTGSGAAPTNGQLLIGSTGTGAFAPATVTSAASTIAFTAGSSTLAMDVAANAINSTYLGTDILQHVQVQLSSAQILALNATAVQLVASVGGKIIVPVQISLKITGGSATYAAGSTVQAQWHTGPVAAINTIAAAFFQAANGVAAYQERNAIDATLAAGNVNDPLELKATGAAFTTGNGVGVVDVWYRLAPG